MATCTNTFSWYTFIELQESIYYLFFWWKQGRITEHNINTLFTIAIVLCETALTVHSILLVTLA